MSASGTATVRAVTVIRTSPPGFQAPYTLAVVATAHGTSLRLVDPPLAHLEPGDEVTLIGGDVATPLTTSGS